MSNTIPTSAEVKMMLHRCGFSQTEAAEILGKDARTVRRWVSGEFEIPSENWQSLTAFCDRLDQTAREKLEGIKKIAPGYGPVTVQIARTDDEAHRHGYPCAGATLALARRIVEWAPEGVHIVPVHLDRDPVKQAVIDLRAFINR